MNALQTITPHLWYDKEARDAAELYTTLFDDSKIKSTIKVSDSSVGGWESLTVDLAGQEFSLLSAGPLFKFNPSVSFHVGCTSADEVDRLWAALIQGGSALMELDAYPFSQRYGWLQDRFGLSWQVMHMGERGVAQKITPTLMFVGDVCGKAEEAIGFYQSVFPDSGVDNIMRYGKGEEPDREGTVRHAAFRLRGQRFAAMDSAHEHNFAFNEAISFMVHCDTQEEIDHYWDRLSAVPESEQCGWLKDKYGLSWQVVPGGMDDFMNDPDEKRRNRVMEVFLKMKKIDIAELQAASRS